MAIVKGKPLPVELREAQTIVEMNCHPTLTELDNMPAILVESIALYRYVKAVKESGD